MSDDLKDLMKSAFLDYEAAGVDGSEGARAMRDGLARIEELEYKLDQAQWLLIDASVQLREGEIKTRRNRADLIYTFLAGLKGQDDE